MNVVTEHVARFGLPAEVVHAVLTEIEQRYQHGDGDLEIALRFAEHIPGSPYANLEIVAEVTDLLDTEYAAPRT